MTLDALKLNARRKTVLESGITKRSSPAVRRRTFGVVGDKVFIPGSPVTTLPQLLKEAEASLQGTPERDLTPKRAQLYSESSHVDPLIQTDLDATESPLVDHSGPRNWTKDDWRNLDACFTDERLILGARQGFGTDQLASVDDVQLEDVVDRFIEEFGPIGTQDSDDWDR